MIATLVVAGTVALGTMALGGAMTTIGPWYRMLRKPQWQPPDWLFGPAWAVILGLAAIAGAFAWENAPDAATRWRVIILFAINISLHIIWSPMFFRWRRPDLALIEMVFLWLSIVALIIGLSAFSPLTPWLLGPYFLWVSFAFFLNRAIVLLNPPFKGS